MKVGLPQLSISERVNAAKINPNSTDTSDIPTEINPSPGDSTITPIDATGLNRAGGDINAQTQQGNRATSDSARKSNNPANSVPQYDKQTLSAADQAQTASKSEDLAQTPPPKTKGFKESLLDQQIANGMQDRTGGDRGQIDADYGHDNGNPNEYIKPQPESEPIRRDKMTSYNNNNSKVPEPSQFPISSFDKENNMQPYKAPEQNLGPVYKPKNLSAPKITQPSPKFNTPRFK